MSELAQTDNLPPLRYHKLHTPSHTDSLKKSWNTATLTPQQDKQLHKTLIFLRGVEVICNRDPGRVMEAQSQLRSGLVIQALIALIFCQLPKLNHLYCASPQSNIRLSLVKS